MRNYSRVKIALSAALMICITAAFIWHRSRNVSPTEGAEPQLVVAVAAIVEIPPITELREGFESELIKLQPGRQVTFREFNAQGDPGLVNQIVDQLVASPPDLVFALGTPIAQAIQGRAPDLLVIQGGVTDPVEAGLADSFDGSGRNYAATSDLPPVEELLRLIRACAPGAARLGAVYNPGEANSAAVIRRLREAGSRLTPPIKVVDGPISASRDVPSAVESLVGRVDVLFLPPDNTAAAAMDVMAQIAQNQRLPFFATAASVLDAGALAVVSVDYRELGVDSAVLASRILGGASAATLPINPPANPTVLVSAQVAEALGIDLSEVRAAFPNVRIQ